MAFFAFIAFASLYHCVAAVRGSKIKKSPTACVAPPQPHILFILADDLGYNELGFRQNLVSPANPNKSRTTSLKYQTPNIDRLAEEGVILDRYYVQSLCSPSRAALMTGRYPFRYGFAPWVIREHQTFGLPTNETTIAEMLRSAGYSTHMVGKWHLGHADQRFTPTFRGFQSFLGFLGSHQDYFKHTHLGAVDFRESDLQMDASMKIPPITLAWNGSYSTDVFVERSKAIVRQHDPSKPLFLYLAFQSIHSEYRGAPQSFLDKYPDHWLTSQTRMAAAMVTALDKAVGEVEEVFKERGLWNDTVLIFSTDNGGNKRSRGWWPGGSNFPLRGTKFTDFEGGIRGNCFVRGTQKWHVPAGTRTMGLAHITDWFPTLAHLAGKSLDEASKLDGDNIWELISLGREASRTSIIINVPYANESLDVAAKRPKFAATIIHDNFKLMIASDASRSFAHPDEVKGNQQAIVNFNAPKELLCNTSLAGFTNMSKYDVSNILLFDVVADPWECTNLAGEEGYKEKVDDMLEDLKAHQIEAAVDLSGYYDKYCKNYAYKMNETFLVGDDGRVCSQWFFKHVPEDADARCG